MTYSYDRVAAAKGLSTNDFDALKRLILGDGDATAIMKGIRKIQKNSLGAQRRLPKKKVDLIRGYLTPVVTFKGDFPHRRPQLAEQLDIVRKDWEQYNRRMQENRKAIPKAQKLRAQLVTTIKLMDENLADPGADFTHAVLREVEPRIEVLIQMIDRMIELNE